MKSKSAHLARLIRFLTREDDFTYAQLIAYTGIHRDTAERLMRELRKAGPSKMYRVASWAQDTHGRYTVMVFGRGTNPDAPKPPPISGAERQARSKARRTARAIGRAVLGHVGSAGKASHGEKASSAAD